MRRSRHPRSHLSHHLRIGDRIIHVGQSTGGTVAGTQSDGVPAEATAHPRGPRPSLTAFDGAMKVQRCGNQPKVGERLGKIAKALAAGPGLLRVKADMI